MASGFPPQKQETQPGIQHVMEPTPEFSSSNYKPSNKLHVYIGVDCFFYSRFVYGFRINPISTNLYELLTNM